MKRLIYLSALLLFFFISCDSPLNNSVPTSQDASQPNAIAPEVSYSLEPIQPDTVRQTAWQQFKTQNGAKWRVRWNEHTGLPVSLFSGTTEKKYSGNAEQAARTFLADHRALFAMKSDPADLNHKTTSTNPYGLRRVTFQQQYKGIPVEEAEYIVQIYKDGRIGMANGYYYPNIDVPSAASISSGQAISTAKADLNLTNPSGESHSTELVVYLKEEGSFTLAWKTIIFAEQPFTDWLYYIDAVSGTIIKKHNRIMDVTGTGDVYPTHPGLSSVTTVDLFRLNGNGSLQGTYVNVVNDDGAEASSGTHDFTYSTTNTHFDEVNLYFHVDDFRQNFIENVAYAGDELDFVQITARAHRAGNDVNASFSPSTGEISFGDAASDNSFNNFAREDKVIHHEYSHAVIYDIESGISSSNDEEGAISEGTPDYFAGAHAERSLIGDYVFANRPNDQRDMASPEIISYSQYLNESPGAHRGGEFFSAILWDLRGSSGAGQIDFLVYDALHGVSSSPTFLEFRDAMITSSNASYGGLYNNAIQTAFAGRGVGDEPTGPEFSVTIDGTQNTYVGAQNTWTADVSNGTSPFSYSWQKRDKGQSNFFVVGSGSSYTETISGTEDFDLKVIVTDSQNNDTEDQINVKVNENIPFH